MLLGSLYKLISLLQGSQGGAAFAKLQGPLGARSCCSVFQEQGAGDDTPAGSFSAKEQLSCSSGAVTRQGPAREASESSVLFVISGLTLSEGPSRKLRLDKK